MLQGVELSPQTICFDIKEIYRQSKENIALSIPYLVIKGVRFIKKIVKNYNGLERGGLKLKLTPNLTTSEFHLGVNLGYTRLGKSRSFKLY